MRAYDHQLTRPTSAQIVASLQGVLEEDAASEETAAANNKDAYASAPRHPRDFSKICRDKQTTEGVDVDKLKTELFKEFTASFKQGSVRIAKPAPRVLREPPVAQRSRSLEGGAPPGTLHSRTWSLPTRLPSSAWLRLPDVSRLVRESFPKKIQGDIYFYSWQMQRLSTSMRDWMVSGSSAGIEGCQRNCN